MEWVGAGQDDPVFWAAAWAARALCAYHRVELSGAERLPSGPALLVGNHGLFGLETPLFFSAVFRATGRAPVGLADRLVLGTPPIRQILCRLGGVPGTRENALRLLAEGHWVVCYPGGSREVFKAPSGRRRLAWERSKGFAHVAIAAGVAVVPFAGLGVDDTYFNLGHLPLTRRLLGRYAVPVAVGLGALPLPVKIRFVVGEPLRPPRDLREAARFKVCVRRAVEALMGSDAAPTRGAVAVIP